MSINLGDLGIINDPTSAATTNLGAATSIGAIVVNILNWLLTFVGGLALLAVIYSGILYITSAGDEAKAETAKKNLTWAIIGVVLVALCYVIVNTVQTVLTTESPNVPTVNQNQPPANHGAAT